MNKHLIYGLSMLLGFVLIAYNACSATSGTFIRVLGTETTNPMAPTSDKVVSSVCSVINRCHPEVNLETCEIGILQTEGFGSPLGLSSSDYSTLSSVIQAEQSGILTGNSSAASTCYTAINTLECSNESARGAYDPSLPNPFANSPKMIPTASCDQIFTPGVNLEIPVELVDYGLSSQTSPVAFSRTRTSFNTSDYDGQVTYYFDIVANNKGTAARNVSMINSAGKVVAAISVPSTGNDNMDSQRYETTFTPTLGANNYRIQLDGTAAADQLSVFAARIRVKQVGATQTKIYIPLTAGIAGDAKNSDSSYVDDSTTTVYSQPNGGWYSRWQKNNSSYSQLAKNSPWTFEAVLSTSSGGTAYASLFNARSGSQISASEVSTPAATPDLVSKTFADDAPNFNDLDEVEVKIKENGGIANIYRSGLWIKLEHLNHAEVYFRTSLNLTLQPGHDAFNFTFSRLVLDISAFNQPKLYHEVVGSVSGAGTACAASIFDNGVNDFSLAGSAVSESALNISSTALSRQRSAAVTLPSNHRLSTYFSDNPGPGFCGIVNSFIVVGF